MHGSPFPACVGMTPVAHRSDNFWQLRFSSLCCVLYTFTVRMRAYSHFSAAPRKAATSDVSISSTKKKQCCDAGNTSLLFLFFFCSPQFSCFSKKPFSLLHCLFRVVDWILTLIWVSAAVPGLPIYFHLDLLLKWKHLFEIADLRVCFWTVQKLCCLFWILLKYFLLTYKLT